MGIVDKLQAGRSAAREAAAKAAREAAEVEVRATVGDHVDAMAAFWRDQVEKVVSSHLSGDHVPWYGQDADLAADAKGAIVDLIDRTGLTPNEVNDWLLQVNPITKLDDFQAQLGTAIVSEITGQPYDWRRILAGQQDFAVIGEVRGPIVGLSSSLERALVASGIVRSGEEGASRERDLLLFSGLNAFTKLEGYNMSSGARGMQTVSRIALGDRNILHQSDVPHVTIVRSGRRYLPKASRRSSVIR